MGTRAIVVLLVGLTLVFVPLAEAQQTKKVPRIGYLSSFDPAAESTRSEPFRRALSERGYIEGQNIAIDYRYAEGKVDRFPELAAELARLKVEIIVVSGGPTVRQRTGILFFYPFTVGTTSEKKTASQKNFTQNLAGHQMPWHVDNKQTLPDSTEKMLDYKGLITLIYLDDIDHGPFQFVRGSHLWTSAFYKEMWDDVIEKYSKDIVSFNNQKAGTAIFYDTRGIHRAEPFQKGSPRTALFAQYADFDKPTGEPIFINTEHMAGLSERSIQVLRFGRKASARTWPIPADKIQSAQTETRRSSYLSMIKSVIGI